MGGWGAVRFHYTSSFADSNVEPFGREGLIFMVIDNSVLSKWVISLVHKIATTRSVLDSLMTF